MKKHELKNVELFEEKGQYYLKLKYVIEDDHTIKVLDIPKVELPFNAIDFPEIQQDTYYSDTPFNTRIASNTAYLLAKGSPLRLHRGEVSFEGQTTLDVCWMERLIKEKRKEMTVSEIEKKLGYKIKIVAEG